MQSAERVQQYYFRDEKTGKMIHQSTSPLGEYEAVMKFSSFADFPNVLPSCTKKLTVQGNVTPYYLSLLPPKLEELVVESSEQAMVESRFATADVSYMKELQKITINTDWDVKLPVRTPLTSWGEVTAGGETPYISDHKPDFSRKQTPPSYHWGTVSSSDEIPIRYSNVPEFSREQVQEYDVWGIVGESGVVDQLSRPIKKSASYVMMGSELCLYDDGFPPCDVALTAKYVVTSEKVGDWDRINEFLTYFPSAEAFNFTGFQHTCTMGDAPRESILLLSYGCEFTDNATEVVYMPTFDATYTEEGVSHVIAFIEKAFLWKAMCLLEKKKISYRLSCDGKIHEKIF